MNYAPSGHPTSPPDRRPAPETNLYHRRLARRGHNFSLNDAIFLARGKVTATDKLRLGCAVALALGVAAGTLPVLCSLFDFEKKGYLYPLFPFGFITLLISSGVFFNIIQDLVRHPEHPRSGLELLVPGWTTLMPPLQSLFMPLMILLPSFVVARNADEFGYNTAIFTAISAVMMLLIGFLLASWVASQLFGMDYVAVRDRVWTTVSRRSTFSWNPAALEWALVFTDPRPHHNPGGGLIAPGHVQGDIRVVGRLGGAPQPDIAIQLNNVQIPALEHVRLAEPPAWARTPAKHTIRPARISDSGRIENTAYRHAPFHIHEEGLALVRALAGQLTAAGRDAGAMHTAAKAVPMGCSQATFDHGGLTPFGPY